MTLDGVGWHPAAWTEPRTRPSELATAAYWNDQVVEAQRGLLDFVTIEDSYRPRAPAADALGRRPPDGARGRLDAVMVAARVAPRVPGIGLLPAVITTLTEPFLVSAQIATLDFISAGRAGWLAQVSSRAEDASYVGPRPAPADAALLAEAADHIEVVRRLWDSWEDGAEIRDAVTHRFLDRERIHPIDFTGEFFSVKGPSITPRPPQGQPIVAMLGASPETIEVAAECADLVLLQAADEPALRGELARLRGARAGENGVHAEGPHVLADVAVFLDAERGRAVERHARLDGLSTSVRDGPLVFAGTPEELAERLIEWRELGLSGFRLHPGVIPHDLEAITRLLVPALQRRGVYRSAYEADTLRGLLGLPRPANRYAARAAQEPVMPQ